MHRRGPIQIPDPHREEERKITFSPLLIEKPHSPANDWTGIQNVAILLHYSLCHKSSLNSLLKFCAVQNINIYDLLEEANRRACVRCSVGLVFATVG